MTNVSYDLTRKGLDALYIETGKFQGLPSRTVTLDDEALDKHQRQIIVDARNAVLSVKNSGLMIGGNIPLNEYRAVPRLKSGFLGGSFVAPKIEIKRMEFDELLTPEEALSYLKIMTGQIHWMTDRLAEY